MKNKIEWIIKNRRHDVCVFRLIIRAFELWEGGRRKIKDAQEDQNQIIEIFSHRGKIFDSYVKLSQPVQRNTSVVISVCVLGIDGNDL